MSGVTRTRLVALAVLLVALGTTQPAAAAQRSCQLDPDPPAAHPRIVSGELDGIEYNVLLPSDYATSNRRYPVLYLLHARNYSAHSWLARSGIEEFTRGFTGDRAAIVVMPDGGPNGFHFDYFDGSQLVEQYQLRHLLPHIDRSFRTIPDGAHRAVAGMSIGGHGAMNYAARHPDLFAAAGSLSGVVHLTIPEEPYLGPGDVPVRTDAGAPGEPRGPSPPGSYQPPRFTCAGNAGFGNRATEAWHWHANNPSDLATNLRGLGLYVMAGNGTPCGPDDVKDDSLAAAAEPAALEDARYFERVLIRERIDHIFDAQPCGLHNMATAARGMRGFWDPMVRAFGRPVPRSFDFRSMDRDFDVWGWTFRADPSRAPEFLEVDDASAGGLTLIGSGTATVVTPRLFRPGERVTLAGALPATARADAGGKLTFAVDLGPANTRAQFSESYTPTFAARRVRFGDAGSATTRGGAGGAAVLPARRDCSPGARLKIRMLRLRARERRRSVAISIDGRRVLVRRGRRAARTKKVILTGLPRSGVVVGVRVRTTQSRTLKSRRSYAPCG